MLEKAKACLRSGARESLRSTCGQTAHRSKRLVHSSFWNHGAGDLDLPPYMLSTALPHLPFRSDSSDVKRGRSDGKESAVDGGAGTDGIFLDFLYPPQALALMSRMTGSTVERWERRNARRLPDGFVQTSRGYASSARSPGKKSEKTQKRESEVQGYKRGDAMKHLGIKPAERESVKSGSNDGEGAGQSSASMEGPDTTRKDGVSESDFGFSPGELAEVSLDYGERIRRVMQSSRQSTRGESERGQEMAQKVLKLYKELDLSHRYDVRLNMELLDWLAVFPGDEVEARCLELYRSIPLGLRTSQVYLSMLTVFLHRGRYGQAFILLKDALGNISNGDQVAIAFFQHVLKEQKWQFAIQIESQFRQAQQHLPEPARVERFWLLVSGIPELLRDALRLRLHLVGLEKKKLLNEQTSRFAARFFKEALVQEFQAFDDVGKKSSFRPGRFPSHLVGQLFRRITPWSSDAASFHQEMIVAMISPACKYPYADVQRSVWYAYDELKKKFPEYRMPMDVLMGLLQRSTRYFDPLARKQLFLRTISPAVVCSDWIRWYGKLRKDALDLMLIYTAKDGNRDRFEPWLHHLQRHYPAFADQRDSLWTTIYISARRNDLQGARAAFDEFAALAKEHRELPPLQAWNVLIHAYHRADDLDGGINVLMDMIEKDMPPSEYSFGPVMEMLGKRGDVDGIQDLLAQYDSLVSDRRDVHFYGSLMNALINCGEVDKAEAVLHGLVKDVKVEKTVSGSLTGCFNILLTAHAHRRNVDATMATYRWMKSEGVRVDGETFAALMQSLAVYRQTRAAYKILRKGMTDAGVRPTAFHYAIVIMGFVNEGKNGEALEAHADMMRRKIKPSLASNAAYLRAQTRKGLSESDEVGSSHAEPSDGGRLELSMREFRRLLQSSEARGAGVASAGPYSLQVPLYQRDQPLASYFGYLISMLGRERCFEAATKLFEEYRARLAKERGPDDATAEVPMQILTAMMSAHHRAGEYDQVEKYWMLAKEQADLMARRIPVPMLTKQETKGRKATRALPDLMDVEPPAAGSDASEAGFQIAMPVKEAETKLTKRDMKKKSDTALTATASSNALLPDSTSTTDGPTPQQPAPGRTKILDRPLRWYLYALSRQSRTQDMLTTVSQALAQGYTMDNKTWNSFIQTLVEANPPLTLLAFILAERFLMPSWPGWDGEGRKRPFLPNPSARAEGLQYIRARYLRPGQLMPRYSTLVHLGAALLKLRRLEVSGELSRMGGQVKELRKYIGTAKMVREQAPKTLFAVQSMPAVEDRVQNTLLRGEAGSFGREGR